MRYKFEFNDWDLRELDSILIQPKKDGNGYTVHKTMKPEPGDGLYEWKNSIMASFEKAQENSERNKSVIEALKAELNRVRSVGAVQLNDKNNQIEKLQNNCKNLEEKVDDLQTELNNVDKSAAAWKKKVDDLQTELEEYKTRNRGWQMRYNELLNKKEESKPVFVGYSFTLEADNAINETPKWQIDNGDPYEKFKAEFPELEITEVDFSDHQTLNNVFKKCFSLKRDRNSYKQKDFLRFIDAFERGATVFDNFGRFDLHWLLLFFLDDSPTWLSDNHKELERYQWNKEHPFKYSINTIFDPETHITEYYVVFNSAPEYRD